MAIETGYQGSGGENGKGEVFEHASRMVDEARAFGSALSGSVDNLGKALDLREAMPIANRAGGIVVGKFGTATVSYEELFG